MINGGSPGRPLGLASGTSNEHISAKGEAGQLPFFCREGVKGSRCESTQLQEGKAKQRATLLRPPGTSAQASPGGPKDGYHVDPEMGSLHRPQSVHPEESSVLFQPWGPWMQTRNCPVLKEPESTIHSFIHPFNKTAAYLPNPGAMAVNKTVRISALNKQYGSQTENNNPIMKNQRGNRVVVNTDSGVRRPGFKSQLQL